MIATPSSKQAKIFLHAKNVILLMEEMMQIVLKKLNCPSEANWSSQNKWRKGGIGDPWFSTKP